MASNIVEKPLTCNGLQSVEKKDFIQMLEDFFRSYIENSYPQNEIECIRVSLDRFSQYLSREKLAKIYIETLFDILEMFRSTNSNIIKNLLEEFILRGVKEHYGESNVAIQILSPSPLDRGPIAVWKESKERFINNDYFYLSVFRYKLKDMERLLRYGVDFQMPDHHLRKYIEERICNLENFGAPDIIFDDIYKIYNTHNKRRRLYFLLLILESIIFKRVDEDTFTAFSCVDFVKLFFKTIPDPLITVSDIIKLLSTATKAERHIEEVCGFFRCYFPRGLELVQPRSLKHLCRVQVRECLKISRKLPHGVWDLHYPHLLQNYILLQEKDDDFISGIFCKKRPLSDIQATKETPDW